MNKNIKTCPNDMLNEFKEDKYIKIIKISRGKNALNSVKKIFFPNNPDDADKWSSRWNKNEISKSIFFIYETLREKNNIVACKFIIGCGKNLVVLGEIIDE